LEEPGDTGQAISTYRKVIDLDNENIKPLLKLSEKRIDRINGIEYLKKNH